MDVPVGSGVYKEADSLFSPYLDGEGAIRSLELDTGWWLQVILPISTDKRIFLRFVCLQKS
jgi:hypothetical protein